MPTLDKVFTLTVSVEQFLSACSETELQELELLLPSYLDRIRRTQCPECGLFHPLVAEFGRCGKCMENAIE